MIRAVAAAALFAVLLAGCHAAPKAVRKSLEASATALHAADHDFAERYTAKATEALADSATLDEYRSEMRKYDKIVAALNTAKDALFAAQTVVDSWDSYSDGRHIQAVACTAQAVAELEDALVDAGVSVPGSLAEAADMVVGLAHGFCAGGAK